VGILWTVWPLDDQMKKWLSELSIEHPNVRTRFPTGNEVKQTLANLEGYRIDVIDNGLSHSWQAWIESDREPDKWTLLNITSYSGDDEPQEIWFEKGHEDLIKQLVQLFAQRCGPLVLIADVGGDPMVIAAS
jgi:hypothetical protein